MLVVLENVVTSPFMNILIEDAETLEYFTNDNKWAKKASDGKKFEAMEAAFQVAKKESINKFNIVYYITQTEQFINMNHGRGKGAVISPA